MSGKRRTLYLNGDAEWNRFKAMAVPNPSAVLSEFVKRYIAGNGDVEDPEDAPRPLYPDVPQLRNDYQWFNFLWSHQSGAWVFPAGQDPAEWVLHVNKTYGHCCDLSTEAQLAIGWLTDKQRHLTNIVNFFEHNWMERSFGHKQHVEDFNKGYRDAMGG